MRNNKGIALFLAIGFVAITAAVILGLGILLNSYRTTSTSYREKEYSIQYANLALEEIKWNLEKEYKDWMYNATHTMGSDNYYDYDPRADAINDGLRDGTQVNPDTDRYEYSSVPTQNFDDSDFQESYWIKVVDHYINQAGEIKDMYSSDDTSQPLGRTEGWIRVAQKPEGAGSKFTYIYDIFCKGTSYRGIDLEYQDGGYVYTGSGRPPRVTFIRSKAKKGDSLSLSEFNIAVFDGHINVGSGYNVYGRLHANDYINFIDNASTNLESIARFHQTLSTSNEGSGFYFGGTNISPSNWESWVDSHEDDTVTTDNGTSVDTYGFEGWSGAYAGFMGDEARPDIIEPIKPKTERHFDKVKNAAQKYGILVEGGNVNYMFLHPGDPTKNGDGKVYIELDRDAVLYKNGDTVSGTEHMIALSDLESNIIYVEGKDEGSVGTEGSFSTTKGYPTTSGIYQAKGIRGLAGVLDGQLSIFSGYDIVLAGDLIYQEYLDDLKFTFTDYRSNIEDPAFNYVHATSLIDSTYGIVRQAPLISGPAIPEYNNPNILGVNAYHDVIIPGNLYNNYYKESSGWGSEETKYYNEPYAGMSGSNLLTDRCDQQGSGILTSGTASGDGKADLFTFGVFYAGHRVYGETPSSNEDTYARPYDYVNNKGTWFIYGGVGCYKQVYATLSSGYGYNYRSYNYDPNLYNFEPPYTISIESQPIWNWRVVKNYPDGISPK